MLHSKTSKTGTGEMHSGRPKERDDWFMFKESPSKCRPSSPSALVDLTIEDICMEWSTRAPIFYAFLITAGVPSRRADVAFVKTLPSVAVAGSVLHREWCKEMNSLQHLLSVIIKFSPYQVSGNYS
jgi:hypothetical protein